ncbi:hypothetical protein Yalta_148 [Yalta virus]|nr:hypothetical protein Yalta_148 [Yalta virus]
MSFLNSKTNKNKKSSDFDDFDVSDIEQDLRRVDINSNSPTKKLKKTEKEKDVNYSDANESDINDSEIDVSDVDDFSDDDNIPEISFITNIEDICNNQTYSNDDDDENITLIKNGEEDSNSMFSVLEVDDEKPKKKTRKTVSGVKTSKTRKSPSTPSIYSKRKDNSFNLKRLKEHLNLSETLVKNVYSFSNQEMFIKSFKFPLWASISKKSDFNNLKNLCLVITDDCSIETKLKQELISRVYKDNIHPAVLFLNVNPYTAFIKLFLDLKAPVLSFNVLQSIISLFLISDNIVLSTKFPTSSYIFALLAQKINASGKIIFKPANSENGQTDQEYSDKVHECLKDFNVDTGLLCNFLKLNKSPETYNEQIILDVFKIFNFKSQLKYESFDGLTKVLLRCIKKKQLFDKPFTFLTLINEFALEYPMIPEKDILNHYVYIIKNFGQISNIPLFYFEDTNINKRTPVRVNKDVFNKILSITIIVKKSYSEYWSCLLPCQLFYGKDFYSLNLEYLKKYFIENDTNKIIMDNDGKMYRYTQSKGVILNKSVYQLELSGPDNNILKYTDPMISREEFILKLIQKGIPHTIANNNIVIQDIKKVSRYLKFALDKENTIFDFKNVIVMGKNTDKVNHYSNVLKYYNDYIQFNMKLFKGYMIQYLMINNENIKKRDMLKELYKRETQTTALLHSGNYPASYDIEDNKILFDTQFFEDLNMSDINIEEIDSEECLTFIKNKLKVFYNNY